MTAQDIRWIQRFNNFLKAFSQLREAVALGRERQLSRLEGQGLIQAFEYTHELAWNTLKDFLESRGASNLYGSRDTTREAFRAGLIENGEAWMNMITSRNLTSHTYDEATAEKIIAVIRDGYCAEFAAFKARFDQLRQEEST